MNTSIAGKWALITGASSGFGAEFARQFAARGAHLVLTGRGQDALRAIEQEVTQRYQHIKVYIVEQDLGTTDGVLKLYDQVRALGVPIDILINNAGFGLWGNFLDIAWEKEQQLLQVDIVALTYLTRLFAVDMVERRFGYILQMASNGAYQPTPTYAIYSAAKSYVLSFGYALGYELRHAGVHVFVLSPGPTRTGFLNAAGQKENAYQRSVMMDAPTVIKKGIDAMLRGRSSLVVGLPNAWNAWLTRFAPRRLATALAARAMRADKK